MKDFTAGDRLFTLDGTSDAIAAAKERIAKAELEKLTAQAELDAVLIYATEAERGK
jgi:hypothetical protein